MKSNSLSVRYKTEQDIVPEKISVGDWIDLRATERLVLQEGEEAVIHLGIAMELPEGYEAHVAPRSSTFRKWGVIQTNSVGIIDNSYCGDNDEWMMEVICLKPRDELDGVKCSIINPGDRVCQFRIMPSQPKIEFIKVNTLGNPDRGGFGSTGHN